MNTVVKRNPILAKELRARMRGNRAIWLITIYVLAISIITLSIYGLFKASSGQVGANAGSEAGKLIFAVVILVELLFISFISPAFTAGAISGERERRTYNLLRTTLLPAERIVRGKLYSSLAFILLLLVVSIPLQSYAFLMGGITFVEVILAFVIMLVTALAYGSLGLYLSTKIKKTQAATITTLLVIFALVIVLPLIFLVLMGIFGNIYIQSNIIEAIISYIILFAASTNPLTTAILTEVLLIDQQSVFFMNTSLMSGSNIPMLSPWIIYTIFMLILTFIIIRLTIREVRKVDV